MSSTPVGKQTVGYKIAIVALVAVVIILIGVIAQLQRDPSQAAPATEGSTPVSGSQSPEAADATPTGRTEEQQKLENFLRKELPRRQEGDPLAMGRVDAPVVLTEWSDYRCPFCSVFAEETLPHLQRYIDEGTVRVEFRDLAIFGDESVKAATAARAAGEQGRYFDFAHELFVALPNEGHPDIPEDLVIGIVEKLGLDVDRFRKDWADPALTQAVRDDSEEAQRLGLTSTPSFVVGSEFVAGAQPLDYFEQLIEAQAAQPG